MTFDPSDDFTIFDGAETVTYQQPGRAPFTVSGVLREQLSTTEAQVGSQIGLQPTDSPFNFPEPNMNEVTPLPGDGFVDGAGVGWTVLTVAFDSLIDQYRLICRRRRA